MLSNPFKAIFLIIIVLSKEFLVLNEEILIVLAFSIFIYLVLNNASFMISEELDEKSKTIQNKFDVYKNIQEKTILYLFDYYNKREILSEKIQKISNIKRLRVDIINRYCKTNFKRQPLLQLEDALNRFILNEYICNAAFQKTFVVRLNKLKTIIKSQIK